MDFAEQIGDFLGTVGNGIKSFVDFVISLPTLIYNILDLIPDPLYAIINAFIGFLIFIIFLKVVRLIVG